MAARLWPAPRLYRCAGVLAAARGTAGDVSAGDGSAGDGSAGLSRAALRLYGEAGCGNMPWSVLLGWLRHPPPPPPPWLEGVRQAAGSAVLAARVGAGLGRQLGAAASAVIGEALGRQNPGPRSARGAGDRRRPRPPTPAPCGAVFSRGSCRS